MIYTISHKSPDLDSVVASIAYAALKNKLSDNEEYAAASAGAINKETAYILDKFNINRPQVLDNIAGKTVVLVDHNEPSQIQDGFESAKIIEVLDHHKIKFDCSEPIQLEVRPWGSSCSIVADKYFANEVEIEKELASALLAGVLVDTIITKSPTYTKYDGEIIEKLSAISGIAGWREFGMEVFKVRSDIADYTNDAIIRNDFKDFEFKAGKFGVGQVETADVSVFESRVPEFLEQLNVIRAQNNYHSVILFITDIINEGSLFLVASSDENAVSEALNAELQNHQVYITGILSRKKQVIPMLEEKFN